MRRELALEFELDALLEARPYVPGKPARVPSSGSLSGVQK